MFGFAPKSPVSPEVGSWIEASMQRFASFYGENFVQTVPMVTPTEDFFPGDFAVTLESGESTFNKVCTFMTVDPNRLTLRIYDDKEEELAGALKESMSHWQGSSNTPAGLYINRSDEEKIIIAIKKSKLREPISLIGTIAHELGHVLLLADGKINHDDTDMEQLTDLITVFFGMGIFTANSAASFSQFSDGTKQGWSVKRQGYLSEEMYGYALAYFALLRNERKPAWAKHLNFNVSSYFRQSIKFLSPSFHSPYLKNT